MWSFPLSTNLIFILFWIFFTVPNNGEKKTLTAMFNPSFSGGAVGFITADYKYMNDPLRAVINIELDLNRFEDYRMKKEYPYCSTPVTKFILTLNNRWNASDPSMLMNDCMPSKTGLTYDSTFSCGPGSQYENHPACTTNNNTYSCSPKYYVANPFSCQIGDLSGKFGLLNLNSAGKLNATFYDFFFAPHTMYNQPMQGNADAQWNFVLSAYCPEHKNPRILCAKAIMKNS